MRLVADIDAQHVVEPLRDGPQLGHDGEGRHDEAQDRQGLLVETLRRAGGEGNPVLGADREADRDRQVMPVAACLQLGHDREAGRPASRRDRGAATRRCGSHARRGSSCRPSRGAPRAAGAGRWHPPRGSRSGRCRHIRNAGPRSPWRSGRPAGRARSAARQSRSGPRRDPRSWPHRRPANRAASSTPGRTGSGRCPDRRARVGAERSSGSARVIASKIGPRWAARKGRLQPVSAHFRISVAKVSRPAGTAKPEVIRRAAAHLKKAGPAAIPPPLAIAVAIGRPAA